MEHAGFENLDITQVSYLSGSVVITENSCNKYLEFNACKRTMGLKWFEIMR